MDTIKKLFHGWNLFEKIWLFSFVAIMFVLGLIWQDSPIALLASITGIISVVLCAKGKVSNYYFAIIQAICYIYISWSAHLYGEVMYNIAMSPVAIIGIINWKKHMSSTAGEVKVRNLSWKGRALVLAIAIVAIGTYMLILKSLGGSFTLFDSASTILSIIAVLLTMLRYTEQWFIWLFVDIVSFIMWILVFVSSGGNITIAVMWLANIINAVYGLINWSKMAKSKN